MLDQSSGPNLLNMSRLVNTVQHLSMAKDINDVMKIVRTVARELTGADGATFVLRDGNHCYYADEDAISPLWKGNRFPMEICISGWVMNNKSAVVIKDIFQDPRIPIEAYRPTFVKSLAMVPIRTMDPLGAIGNYWADFRQPTIEEVKTLQALADITAVSIENIHVRNNLEEKVQERTTEVLQQKKIIEEKNRDITDSISYAKKIQQAKLPPRKDILKAFPNSFILFKPKDIVSGDFYYFHEKQNIFFIAAADCTGHGIPGALMSMIGSERLDDALLYNTHPSDILSSLNRGIRKSLNQTKENSTNHDGMDIALCAVDLSNYTIQFAAANRPIWVIRKGAAEIEEIKATKKAIGGFTEDNQHFNTHTIQLQKDDSFYIFSDGYADCFSDKSKKKLTTKKFKQLLLSISDKSMSEQKNMLNNFIKEWQGTTEQIDDILIIGIRF